MEEGKKGAKGKMLLIVGLFFWMAGLAITYHFEPLNGTVNVYDDGQMDTWDTGFAMIGLGVGTCIAGIAMTMGGAFLLSLTERQWRRPRLKS